MTQNVFLMTLAETFMKMSIVQYIQNPSVSPQKNYLFQKLSSPFQ